jgi:cystathionine beta-lyase
MRMGFGIGGNDAEAVLRSLPSLAVRYRAHDIAARQLARWLQTRNEVAQVLHPALPGSPGHEHWQALCGTDGVAAGLFSVVFDARFGSLQVDAFCDALKLFKLGYSWGGPVSLVVPYDISTMRSAQLGTWKHKGVLVRFNVGLEDVEDLQADLEQAFTALRA